MSLATIVIPSRLHRVSRVPDPAALPAWEYAGDDHTFGNRWDDPHGRYRALYTADSHIGALVETLQDFRFSLTLLSRLSAIEHDEQPERFAGIAAPSSLGLPYTNYTIFENPDAQSLDRLRVSVLERTSRRLERRDADVRHALEHLGLMVEVTRVRDRHDQLDIE